MPTILRHAGYAAALCLAAACLGADASPVTESTPPPIEHVFVIVLENEGFATSFGPASPARYLSDTMVKSGALLRQYYGTGHFSLDNYLAMIAGVAPSPETQLDCGRYVEFVQTGVSADGQPIGRGCVYPVGVPTLANQLAESGRTWRGYFEDMGNDPTREAATCGHAPLGQPDPTERATLKDQYAAKHNPFVYFHSIIDSASCTRNVVPLSALEQDLSSNTPNYLFIAPNLCHDGHDHPCVNGEPGGLVSADRFLAEWVPKITRSQAFKRGLLIVTFDEAGSTDGTACCDEPSGPNVSRPGYTGPGGGRTGAVLLSPFIVPGTVSDVPYNHYSLLKSVEEIFHLPFLGYAGRPGLAGFGADVYTRP